MSTSAAEGSLALNSGACGRCAKRRRTGRLGLPKMYEATLVLRFGLGGLFVFAGLAKVTAHRDFERAVGRYDLLPPRLASIVARTLPSLELAAGLLLLVGLALSPTSYVLAALLLVFAAVVAISLARGKAIECGCFSAGLPSRIRWPTVIQNVTLAVAATLLASAPPTAISLDGKISGARAAPRSSDAAALVIAVLTTLVVWNLASSVTRYRRALTKSLDGGTTS